MQAFRELSLTFFAGVARSRHRKPPSQGDVVTGGGDTNASSQLPQIHPFWKYLTHGADSTAECSMGQGNKDIKIPVF